MAHSEIGASSAHRWINCPGSVRLYRKLTERKSSIYADMGTAAHELCETCLLTGSDPIAALDSNRTINDNVITIDDNIVRSVEVYVNKIRADKEQYGGELKVEQPFSLEWLYPNMFGRNDACLLPTETFGTLRVYDYKNGSKKVYAKENVQMMYYALGALGEHNLTLAETVVQTIVQPNAFGKEPIDEWEISTTDLYAWGHDVLLPAAKRTQEPDAPCISGEWCRFCEAAHLCQTRVEEALAKLEPPRGNEIATLPDSKTISVEDIGKLSRFFNSDEFKDWVKAITAEEQALLARGVYIPGRKLIALEAQGNRKWRNEQEVTAALASYGEDIFINKIRSPSQMEKMLQEHGVKKTEREQILSGFITRDTTTKCIVVDEDDKRVAVAEKQQKALELFDNR